MNTQHWRSWTAKACLRHGKSRRVEKRVKKNYFVLIMLIFLTLLSTVVNTRTALTLRILISPLTVCFCLDSRDTYYLRIYKTLTEWTLTLRQCYCYVWTESPDSYCMKFVLKNIECGLWYELNIMLFTFAHWLMEQVPCWEAHSFMSPYLLYFALPKGSC